MVNRLDEEICISVKVKTGKKGVSQLRTRMGRGRKPVASRCAYTSRSSKRVSEAEVVAWFVAGNAGLTMGCS